MKATSLNSQSNVKQLGKFTGFSKKERQNLPAVFSILLFLTGVLIYLTGKSDAESGKNCKPTQILTDPSMTGFILVPVVQKTKFEVRRSSAFGI